MKLLEILNGVEFTSNKNSDSLANLVIEDITYNSSKANKNNLFVALRGQTVDGHKYVQDAYSRGCRTFILEDNLDLADDTIKIVVTDSRKALSRMSSNFFNNPSSKLKIIGITGTKGKTTVTNYISGVLNTSGINTGVIGTNGAFYNGKKEKTINTTPESYELHRLFAKMLSEGIECVAMEVSSGGLMMDRVSDVDFDIALFTNISPDHIGPKEHPSFEHYLDCKAKLFSFAKLGIVNRDDEYSNYIIDKSKCPIKTFSIKNHSNLQAINIIHSNSLDSLGMEFICKESSNSFKCYIPSPGEFSVYNALSVISVCKELGLSDDSIISALRDVKVDGRVQVLPILPYATVIVDYAHNGMSLESILNTIKMYNPSRILCLFGAVGGRTKGRRKEVGDVTASLCDVCVLTSDNPDFEDPLAILRDIEKSFVNSDCKYYMEPDRKKAIEQIIRLAEPGDVILLAGKGHERYQLINGEHVPFNEPEIATNAAKQLLLEQEELKTKSMDTAAFKINDKIITTELTTPESLDLRTYFRKLIEKQNTYLTMEESSPSIEMERTHGVEYDVFSLSNVSRENINEHGSFKAYFDKKSRFIRYAASNALAIVNLDIMDRTTLGDQTKAKVITFGVENKTADIIVKDLDLSTGRGNFKVVITKELNLLGHRYIPGEFEMELSIPGLHTVYNSMVAIIIALANGVKVSTIQQTLSQFKELERRFEF